MYVNYINDRQNLGFACVKDIEDGKILNERIAIAYLNKKGKQTFNLITIIILPVGLGCILFFSEVEPANAILPTAEGFSPTPTTKRISPRGRPRVNRRGTLTDGFNKTPLKPFQPYRNHAKLNENKFNRNGDNNQGTNNDSSNDLSQYKGGPNPFTDKFNYDNPNHTRKNINFDNEKRLNHLYDRHAKDCFNLTENRNKENLELFKEKTRSFIQSSNTKKINGSYRYETPAYLYKEKKGDLVAVVNATDNSLITVVNATKLQLKNLKATNNFGLDTREPMQFKLKLRGPKTNN